MQYDVSTPTEYLAALDADWRKDMLLSVRQWIHDAAEGLEEGIEYKMLSYQEKGNPVFHLNAQKNFVGLYVGNIEKIDPDGKILGKVDMGKGCIRLKKSTNLEDVGIQEFIAKAMTMARAGDNLDC